MFKRLAGLANYRSLKNIFIVLVFAAVLFFLYFWHIGSLTPGLSKPEAQVRTSNHSLQSIIDKPINAPHRLVQYAFISAGESGAFWMRSASLIFAVIFLSSFYYIIKCWFGANIALFSTLIFASTPLVVNLSRSATATIMLMAPVSAYAAWEWLSRTETNKALPWLVLAVASALSAYVPGGLILLILMLLIGAKNVIEVIGKINNLWFFAGVVLFIILVTPLGMAIYKNPSIYKDLLLLPATMPQIFSVNFAKSLVWTCLGLVAHTRSHIPEIISRLPVLDVVQIVLGFFGIYAMLKKARKFAVSFLFVVATATTLSTLNNNLLILVLCLPALAFFIAAGLRYLYVEWFKIFPRNPLPQAYALLLIGALVLFHVGFGVRYSLMAWPNTPETKTTYVIK